MYFAECFVFRNFRLFQHRCEPHVRPWLLDMRLATVCMSMYGPVYSICTQKPRCRNNLKFRNTKHSAKYIEENVLPWMQQTQLHSQARCKWRISCATQQIGEQHKSANPILNRMPPLAHSSQHSKVHTGRDAGSVFVWHFQKSTAF